MKPLGRWDDGRDVVLAGDAAGVVAPASGEGIYYAMAGGRFAARASLEFLRQRRTEGAQGGTQKLHEGAWARVLDTRHHAALLVFHRQAPRTLRQHLPGSGRAAPDVAGVHAQEIGPLQPLAHVRIFAKDMAHLLGIVRA